MTPGLSVQVVDDDPGSLRMLRAILADAGLVVRTATSPAAALREMADHPPDLLVTDLRMPEMNGLDLLRAARGLYPDLCCLLITGFATDEVIADAFREGAQDLLQKPINVEEVRARVLHAAEVVQLRREVQALRAAHGPRRGGDRGRGSAPRAQELSDLPALPGFGAPVEANSREEVFRRLERLGALFRQGVITAVEFEEKKRALLARL